MVTISSRPNRKYNGILVWIYFVQGVYQPRHIKIGYSQHLKHRIKVFSTHSASPVKLLCAIRAYDFVEEALHTLFTREREHGEWFKPSPRLLAMVDVLNKRFCGHRVPSIILVELMRRAGLEDTVPMEAWFKKMLEAEISNGAAERSSGYKMVDQDYLRNLQLYVESPMWISVSTAN
jgi:hypothetical protein